MKKPLTPRSRSTSRSTTPRSTTPQVSRLTPALIAETINTIELEEPDTSLNTSGVKVVAVHDDKEMVKSVRELQKTLKDKKVDWSHRHKAVQKIRGMVLGNAMKFPSAESLFKERKLMVMLYEQVRCIPL